MASPIKLKELLSFLGRLAPWDLAESWDNVGLMIGNPDQEVTGVVVALDPCLPVLDEAIAAHANTILTHHPFFFHPLKSINTATPQGKFLKKALQHDIAVISCHTNLDIIATGVSDALADMVELQDTAPLAAAGKEEGQGFGKVGTLKTPLEGTKFVKLVAERLNLTALPMSGPLPETVTTVAVCGGSGSELAQAALTAGCQVYITAELKHATSRWAEENGLCILDGGHFATEKVIIPRLTDALTTFFTQQNQTVPILASGQENPLRFYIHR